MNTPYHTALRLRRRSAGLTQDDVARILGTGGRSYIAMLESGDRVPHVRDVVLLSLLFGADEQTLFPHLYLTTKEMFQSNARAVIEQALAEGETPQSERLRFMQGALMSVQLAGNVAAPRI
jgi:transcriptional regulator with XRE-family HTH domain